MKWYWILTPFMALIFLGCSGKAGQKPVFPASGKVTLGGGAVAKATVMFSPKDGQPVATAVTDANGEFRLTTYDSFDGAAEGNYDVLISKSITPEKASVPTHGTSGEALQASFAPVHDASGKGGSGNEVGSAIDSKWSRHGNGLSAEIKSTGKNVFEFKLD